MVTSSGLVSQASDIVLGILKPLEPFVKSLPPDPEIPGGVGSIFLASRMVEHHPFYPQSLLGREVSNTSYLPPELVSALADKWLPLKEIETGWLPHPANSSW